MSFQSIFGVQNKSTNIFSWPRRSKSAGTQDASRVYADPSNWEAQ